MRRQTKPNTGNQFIDKKHVLWIQTHPNLKLMNAIYIYIYIVYVIFYLKY
jgi:hypothetical protein